MGGARKESRHIEYVLIYAEDGEKKRKVWSMDGQTTGKKFKEWHDAVSNESLAIIKMDNVEFLVSAWKGFDKRR